MVCEIIRSTNWRLNFIVNLNVHLTMFTLGTYALNMAMTYSEKLSEYIVYKMYNFL